MRRAALCLLVLTAAALASGGAGAANPPPGATAPGAPPHAWLFGTWTGGLFPVLDGMTAQDCRTQPTVGFAQDVVSHATLLGSSVVARNVETVRATANGAEFRFVPATDTDGGFGCETADTLHVARNGLDEISFPHCSAFPYPLERCPR